MTKNIKDELLQYLWIIALGCILFIPYIGSVHLFDWDEANFAEAAREMLYSKEYLLVQIDYLPFWEKPPLFIWLQTLSMAVFGVHEFAARLPNAVTGIITLCTIFYIGKKVQNLQTAWWWVLMYVASWLPHFYFKTAIIDPVFNLFIFLSFYQFYLTINKKSNKHAAFSGIFLALAVLTKGPVALLIAMLSFGVYIIINKGFKNIGFRNLLTVFVVTFIVSFSWFGIDILQNGWWFTKEFITYQIRLFNTGDAGHGQPFYYHFIVLLFGCFPASAFLFQFKKQDSNHDFTKWMWILFCVTLILFSIVKTKIVHYSSLCYLPLTYLAALQLQKLNAGERKVSHLTKWILFTTGILVYIAIMLLPIFVLNKEKYTTYIKDKFAVANLQAEVQWDYWHILPGALGVVLLVITVVSIKKQFGKTIRNLVVGQLILIPLIFVIFVPKVEKYTQQAAINFYKNFKGQDVYIQTLGFKSYACLFYADKQKQTYPDNYISDKMTWLLTGNTDKPVYFIARITDATRWLDDYPHLEKIGEENGYVFIKKNMVQ